MNAVKGLITAFLCLLLFITIGLIGTATWLKATVLSQPFVNREVQKIDITDLTRNILDQEVTLDLPAEYADAEQVAKDLIVEVVAVYEPWLKDQFDSITSQVYDYLQRRADTLSITIDLRDLKATLKDNLWAIYTDKVSSYLPQLASGVEEYIINNPAEVVQYLPQDFLPASARNLSQDQIVAYMEANPDLVRAQIDSLSMDTIIASLSNDVVEPYFNEFTDSAITEIPDVYDVDTEVLGQDGLNALADARRYLGYFDGGYYALFGLALVLMVLIWVVWREFKRPVLSVGITLAFFGFLELAGWIIARTINPFDYATGTQPIPDYAQNVVLTIYRDALQPMLIFNIVVLVIGLGLLTLSFFLKSQDRRPEPEIVSDYEPGPDD